VIQSWKEELEEEKKTKKVRRENEHSSTQKKS